MGYLFLLMTLFFGLTKGYCGKKTSGQTSNYSGAVYANMIRMIICVIIGLGIILFSNSGSLKLSGRALLISCLSGVSTSFFVVLWMAIVRNSAYMIMDVFITLGMLIPITVSSLVFHEKITLFTVIGLIILFAATVIMGSYNNSIKRKLRAKDIVLLIFCGSAAGVGDLSQKLYASLCNESIALFNLYTYLISALFLVVMYFIVKKSEGEKFVKPNIKNIFWYILVMSVSLFMYTFVKTKTATMIEASKMYPLLQGSSLVGASIMSAILFKEKITTKCILGMILTFIGLIFINVL